LTAVVLNLSLCELGEVVNLKVLFRSPDVQRSLPSVERVVELDSEISGGHQIPCFTDLRRPACLVIHTKTDLRGAIIKLSIVAGEEVVSKHNCGFKSTAIDCQHACKIIFVF
jgi:hypothetical protein